MAKIFFRNRFRNVQKVTMQATRKAIDQTTGAAVVHAKSNHPWTNRTAALEGSLRMTPAVQAGTRISGSWGSYDIDYARYLETGTQHMPPYPYLFPAADAEYPKLPERIRKALG